MAVSGNDGSRVRGRRNHITKLDMNFVYYFPLLISLAHKWINLIRTVSSPILLRHSLILICGVAVIPFPVFTMFYTQASRTRSHTKFVFVHRIIVRIQSTRQIMGFAFNHLATPLPPPPPTSSSARSMLTFIYAHIQASSGYLITYMYLESDESRNY